MDRPPPYTSDDDLKKEKENSLNPMLEMNNSVGASSSSNTAMVQHATSAVVVQGNRESNSSLPVAFAVAVPVTNQNEKMLSNCNSWKYEK